MNAYDTFIEPTAVDHVVACRFILANLRHLVVAKTTLLQVFEVIKVPPSQPSQNTNYKLNLVAQFKLQGKVTDLKPIRTTENPNLDYLLVSTKVAKVSCIKWDHAKNSIATVSLHYYEQAIQNITFESVHHSSLAVSPGSRPVMCLRFKSLLVFLPFNLLDTDDDEHEEDGEHKSKEQVTNGIAELSTSIGPTDDLFSESFMVEASELSEDLGEVMDLQFLHNYREPTVAMLSQSKPTWTGLLPFEKDNVIYTVLSLDPVNREATRVLRIANIPYDVDRIIPLASPLNGALLLGCNVIVHVDSGGTVRRIGVNLYASLTLLVKTFDDKSALELKLENCSVAQVGETSRVLLVLRVGEMYFLNFEVDGRIIKKMDFELADPLLRPGIDFYRPGPMASLDHLLMFIAGKGSDSVLFEFQYHLEGPKVESDTMKDDEDDFYGDGTEDQQDQADEKVKLIIKHDSLVNNGPISSFAMGRYSTKKVIANLPNPSYSDISIFASGGLGRHGHVNIMTPTVQQLMRSSLKFSQVNRLWIINNNYLITSDDQNLKSEIFDITKSYARIPAKHFIHDELTVAIHEINNGKFLLQVTPKHINLLSGKLKNILNLDSELDELKDTEIINSVFNDDILMIFCSSGEVIILTINTYNKKFTRIELPKLLSETIITTGYIANSRLLNAVLKDVTILLNRGQKRKRGEERVDPQAENLEPPSKIFILVTGDNRIIAFSRFHGEKCFQLNSVNKLTNTLNLGFFDINGSDPDPTIKQVILNNLGDKYSKEEHLTILTIGGEIYTYKLHFDGENYNFIKQGDTAITGAPNNAFPQGTAIERRMIYVPDVSGVTCILVTGVIPYLITKTRHSPVRVFKFSKEPIVSFVTYSDANITNGLLYLDTKKNARIIELPQEFNYDNRWPMRRIHIGQTIKSIAYHENSNTLVVSTIEEIPYKAIDEEGSPIVGLNPDMPSAYNYKGWIKLLSPITWTAIDTIELEDNEVGMDVKTMVLDVGSERKRFKSKQEFLLIGVGNYRMEDLSANGAYKLVEIIDIIPEPGKPETNHKFKEMFTEDQKGAATSICEVSGRFLVTQGQKIIVRDIKDNSAVPVAFLDTSVYVSEAKSFGNLVLLGDSLKSVWLAGFDAEPFRMIMLGKDLHKFDVSCADFLVRNEEVHLLIADNNERLHVLLYNPEDPRSSNGQILLHKNSFNNNYNSTCMRCTPKNELFSVDFDYGSQPFQTIGATSEGAMYVVTPVSEATYRRLYILQQQLIDKEFHFCGLNPKLNRIGGLDVGKDDNARPMLDGELLRRFAALNEDRRKMASQKISIKDMLVEIWQDLVHLEFALGNM